MYQLRCFDLGRLFNLILQHPHLLMRKLRLHKPSWSKITQKGKSWAWRQPCSVWLPECPFPLLHERKGWGGVECNMTGFTDGLQAGPVYSHPWDHAGQYHKPRVVTSQDDSGRRWQDREALVKGWSVINLSLNRDRAGTLVDRAGPQNWVVWVKYDLKFILENIFQSVSLSLVGMKKSIGESQEGTLTRLGRHGQQGLTA